MNAAERILKGIKARVDAMESINDIHSYFASDLMIEKVRDLVGQLQQLGDSVKADDIQSRLKTLREDAVRQLKDRQELFVDGAMIIRFGKHRFSVNVQTLDLTTVLRDDQMCLHLTGTNFFEPIDDPELLSARDVWQQEIVSENRDVYRGEYLAFQMLRDLSRPRTQRGEGVPEIDEVLGYDERALAAFVQRFMGPRYNEAYSKGVHDHDAALLLRALLEMKTTIGLLRFHTRARALAKIFWRCFGDAERKQRMAANLSGFGTVTELFPEATAQAQYLAELRRMLTEFVQQTELFAPWLVDEAAEYLFCELSAGARWVTRRIPASRADLVRPQPLIDEVYLPLIGDNLAKQIGVAGEAEADRPHGPAAADLAARLRQDHADGIHRQPAGHHLHEDQRAGRRAPGHLARPGRSAQRRRPRGTEKLNLALEMGDNVMIYVDDIQHCHPEFLQKFISLCDAQRKIEGVYKGRTRTYDLRGESLRRDGGQPVHRERRTVPDPRHAGQPGRHLQPGRDHRRNAGSVRDELPGELPDQQPGAPSWPAAARKTSTASSAWPSNRAPRGSSWRATTRWKRSTNSSSPCAS
jgi:hypothetical protein